MSELLHLLTAYDAHRTAARPCALATVVRVQGSSYRRPGARMLVAETGELTGSVSGGCLEGDARRRARQVIRQGRPVVVTYDSMDPEDDLSIGAQLGCQGIVHILLEPLDFANPANPVELLRRVAQQEAPAVLVTILTDGQSPQLPGPRLLLTADGTWRGAAAPNGAWASQLAASAVAALLTGESVQRIYPTDAGPVRAFIEVILPAPRLTVYGAGNDAQPLVRLVAGLGWRVAVVGGQPAQATTARFPDAETVRVLPVGAVVAPAVPMDFAVLMTHNYHYDLAVLRQLLPTAVPYIGLLGPRKKAERLLAELRTEGWAVDDYLRDRLRSPVGLNLGAETPEEIALSIGAELQAVRAGRPGGPLSAAPGPIHGRFVSLGIAPHQEQAIRPVLSTA